MILPFSLIPLAIWLLVIQILNFHTKYNLRFDILYHWWNPTKIGDPFGKPIGSPMYILGNRFSLSNHCILLNGQPILSIESL